MKTNNKIGALLVAVILTFACDVHAQKDMSTFLKAIHQIEASGRLRPPDGDGGKAIGPFQIHYAYWFDATEFDKSIGGTYQDCRNYDYAKKVIHAYLRRYGKRFLESGNYEALARIHNGGPAGWKSKLTLPYLALYRNNLKKLIG